MADEINFENKVLNKRWKILRFLGKGETADIYLGIDVIRQQNVCVKICKNANSLIFQHEANIMNIVCPEDQKILGFPQLYWMGQDPIYNKHYFIVMEMLGPNLEDLFISCKRKFSLKTVLLIANGCLNQIEQMHKKSYVHCDIKPQNFLMGLDDCSHIVYLIDFGLSQIYKDNNTNLLAQYRLEKEVKGDVKFMSLNTHYKICNGRRDDLESLGYMLIYFLKGALPWEKLVDKNLKDELELVKKKKMDVIFEEYCQDLPSAFIIYLNYCKNLMYYEDPDYNFLKSLFNDLLIHNNYQLDFQYDWVNANNIDQQATQELIFPLQFNLGNDDSQTDSSSEFVEKDAYFKQDFQKQKLHNQKNRKKFSVFKKQPGSYDMEYNSLKEFNSDSVSQTYSESGKDMLQTESEFDRQVTLIADIQSKEDCELIQIAKK